MNIPAPPPDARPDVPGYRIERQLGSGANAAVFLALDRQQQVAVKIVRPRIADKHLHDRLRDEVAVLRRLQHPAIIRLVDSVELADGQPAAILEYVGETDLRSWLKRERPGLKRRLRLFAQIADALSHAHARGVQHGDLAASNILVDGDDRVTVIDFSLSRALRPGHDIPRADIFALGGMLDLLEQDAGKPELRAIIERARSGGEGLEFTRIEALAQEVLRFRKGKPVDSYSTRFFYRLRKHLWRLKWWLLGLAALVFASEGLALLEALSPAPETPVSARR
ncbi:protein kinase domain-containing protein [Alteraurantiacibacter aquimixticola]|uniref:Protein kinase domain-containing protein n=1 Tax=Alteraurantiacibacter aquimixticola TaxID=2489173 RepID=A0A4T3F301_9SPHN|nr:protein kinase [Alteraurantiacibacter aquimixticola]TIX50685.1 hypothetical protein E5222_10570 [Alteraurantiacibacter aquimixticola]